MHAVEHEVFSARRDPFGGKLTVELFSYRENALSFFHAAHLLGDLGRYFKSAAGVEILKRGGIELTAVFFNSLAGIKHRLYPEKPFFGKLSEIYTVYYTLSDEKPHFAACLFAFVKLAVKLYLRVILA